MKDYGKGGRPGKTGKVIPKAIPTTRVTRSAAHNNTTAEPPQPPEPEMNIPRPVTPSRDSVDGEESDDDVIVAGRTTPTPTPTVMTTPTRKRTYQDTVLTMSTPTRKRNATIGDRGMPIRNEGNSLIYNMEVTPLRSAIKRKHDASLDGQYLSLSLCSNYSSIN
ncbi:hypothetical protein BC829DRAFT_107815 [Chytridium lagenaria]|nr:hypothetical protein BC829DRAFT_107815 [Chytridium lagenaria]